MNNNERRTEGLENQRWRLEKKHEACMQWHCLLLHAIYWVSPATPSKYDTKMLWA